MKKEIQNEIDFLVAQAQLETDIAKEVIESIRNKNRETKDGVAGKPARTSSSDGYYEEKVALKMLEFFKEEERVITLYAEAKSEYPILANLMENKRPYLKEMLAEAKKLYGQNK